MIQTPNIGNSKGGKTKGKANRQVAKLTINMNDNPNQNQGKTERQARAEAQSNTKKEVCANVVTTKIVDGSINLQPQTIASIGKETKDNATPIWTNSSDSKDRQEENHDPVPPTVEPMTTTFPTEDQNQTTSNNEVISQDEQAGNNDTSNEENTNTVEAFEKTTKGIENPMFVKHMVDESKGLLSSLLIPGWSRKDTSKVADDTSKVADDPMGSGSSPIRVPIVPAGVC